METTPEEAQHLLSGIDRDRARSRASNRPFAWLLVMDAALVAGYIGTILTMSLAPSAGESFFAVLAMAITVVVSNGLLVRGTASRFTSRWRFWSARQVILAALAIGMTGLTVVAQNLAPFPSYVPAAFALLSFALLGIRPITILIRGPRTARGSNGWDDATTTRSSRLWTVGLAIAFGAVTAFTPVPFATTIVAALWFVVVFASPNDPSKGFGLVFVGSTWRRAQWAGFLAAAFTVYSSAYLLSLNIPLSPILTIAVGLFVVAAISVPALTGRR